MTNLDAVTGPAPGAAAAKPPCQNPTVDLEVEKALLTLKHDCHNRLTVVVSPATCRATEYKIEIQRASGGAWLSLSKRRSFPWMAQIAGKFKVRGMARIEGAEVQSGPKDVEVQFPNYDQIVGDRTVNAATRKEWHLTLKDCRNAPGRDHNGLQQPNLRRERGFFIRIDTKLNRYIFTNRVLGILVGPDEGAAVGLGARPPDEPPGNLDPNARGAKYVVASFHTHTSTSLRTGRGARQVGPSGADDQNNTRRQIPGVVYDYIGPVPGGAYGAIRMGHPLRAPARVYRSLGLDRRPTP
jgi:hypothetical protein